MNDAAEGGGELHQVAVGLPDERRLTMFSARCPRSGRLLKIPSLAGGHNFSQSPARRI